MPGATDTSYRRTTTCRGSNHDCPVRRSYSQPCQGQRKISPERLNGIVDQIEADLRRSGRVEIPSGEIGEMVMEKLKDLDEVAYIRFASVYREFMDLQQVKREIEQVLSARGTARTTPSPARR